MMMMVMIILHLNLNQSVSRQSDQQRSTMAVLVAAI